MVLKNDILVEDANHINRVNAVKFSLLLLPKKFSLFDLFTKIVSISFIGIDK